MQLGSIDFEAEIELQPDGTKRVVAVHNVRAIGVTSHYPLLLGDACPVAWNAVGVRHYCGRATGHTGTHVCPCAATV